MARLQRGERGWQYGDVLVKSVYNIEDVKQHGVFEYPDNSEYGDYFLTTDDWRLRVKLCRIRHDDANSNRWHLQTLRASDSAIYVMSGAGEALIDKDRWVPIKAGDLLYSNAGQVHGIRALKPGDEIWYLSVEGPGPIVVGDVNGRPHSVVGSGPPNGRDH